MDRITMNTVAEDASQASHETNRDGLMVEQNNRLHVFKSRIGSFLKGNSAILILILMAVITTTITTLQYLLSMLSWTTIGFSLDDSWIHLQFARTIAEGVPWEYSLNYPSTGSTSPLWSIVLSTLFLFTDVPLSLVIGTYIISYLFYIASTLLAGLIIYRITEATEVAVLGQIGFVIVPRNTWLYLSGMEAPLFIFLLLLGVWILGKNEPKYDVMLGIVAGLAYLARPEAAAMFGVAIFVRFIYILFMRDFSLKRLASTLLMIGLAGAIVLPWVLHCLNTTGFPLPDTFYAKVHPVTEYEIEVWNFWWTYWFATMPFLAIGLVGGVILLIKKQPYAWIMALTLMLLYRFTMPYQSLINNARYLVPVFNLLMISSVAGLYLIMRFIGQKADLRFPKVTNHLLPAIVITLMLLVTLAPAYNYQMRHFGNSVKNINEMQVYLGMWLDDNIPEDAIIATHDVGALRFFSNRTVIDTAGLVSPDIVHGNMTRVEELEYIRDKGCNYFVFFDEIFIYRYWLVGGYQKIATVHLDDNVISGRDTMSVFYVNWSLTSIGES